MGTQIKKQYGTIDILPSDVLLWQYIEEKLRSTARRYGFEEIRFPTFEATELFCRGVGGTTDIVQKEMYTFDDREKRSLSLRPEGTACVVRSIVENGLVYGPMPLKLYYIANFFRHEKPQKGRSREFFQFGTELYGSDGPIADAMVIMLAASVFRELGITGARLHVNSIGCDNCRDGYSQALKTYFEERYEKLCPTCQSRLATNPRRILDCKDPGCRAVAEDAPRTVDYLCDECSEHFSKLCALLDGAGIEYIVDVRIVRGLDYYTKTVFEFIDETIGAQSTVCGGGRYNRLVSMLGGPELPAVGFGMGLTRLIESMRNAGTVPELEQRPELYIAPLGENAAVRAALLTEQLRRMGLRAECDMCARSMKSQMKYADKLGAEFTVAIGDNELEIGVADLRDMGNGSTVSCELTAQSLFDAIRHCTDNK